MIATSFPLLLLWRWPMEETWAVPQPFLDHFAGGYIFLRVINILFQRESFCLLKCFWSLCKPSCHPNCSHTCLHCFSYHLAVNTTPVAPTRLMCQAFKCETHHELSVCLSASNSTWTQMTMGSPIQLVTLSSCGYQSTINVFVATHEEKKSS